MENLPDRNSNKYIPCQFSEFRHSSQGLFWGSEKNLKRMPPFVFSPREPGGNKQALAGRPCHNMTPLVFPPTDVGGKGRACRRRRESPPLRVESRFPLEADKSRE